MKSWWRSNSFLLGMLGLVFLAWAWPDLGAQGGWLRSEWTRRIAVFLIFLIQGLSLPTEELRHGARQVRVHGFVLACNYVGFPLLAFGLAIAFGPWLDDSLKFGVLYLALLPTTITSAVFFTSAAEGKTALSVFATALSNLASVVLVPLGVSWLLLPDAEAGHSLGAMLLRLVKLIVVPMFIGQVLRGLRRRQAMALKPWFKPITTTSIFFIMYCTFCDGVKGAAWETVGWPSLGATLVLCALLLAVASWSVWYLSGLLWSETQFRIAAFYCGSQKSLATGVPMAASLFSLESLSGVVPDVSVIVVPLMVYHFLQLALAARVAPRLREQVQRSAELGK